MAKKRGNKVPVGQMNKAQQAAFEAQLALQERALEMAQKQVERDREAAERKAQFEAFGQLADLYTSRAGEIGGQYDAYAGQSEARRRAALERLGKSAEMGAADISGAEQALLRNLVAGQAFQNVPLVELGQQQNPLLAGLAAEGASTAGVEGQSAQDAQIAAQLAALTRGAMGQLNVGEQNYLNALRNAGMLSAAQARQQLAGTRAQGEMDIGSEYDRLAQEIGRQRLSDITDYESRAAEAAGQQKAFTPIAEADYDAQLEAARKAAMQSIRRALPVATGGRGGTTPTNVSEPTGGAISDLFGRVSVPYTKLPEGAKLTPQQLKRKREAEDIAALRKRGL